MSAFLRLPRRARPSSSRARRVLPGAPSVGAVQVPGRPGVPDVPALLTPRPDPSARSVAQRGQAMVDYIIVLESLYSCGFPEVVKSISIGRPKLRRFFAGLRWPADLLRGLVAQVDSGRVRVGMAQQFGRVFALSVGLGARHCPQVV